MYKKELEAIREHVRAGEMTCKILDLDPPVVKNMAKEIKKEGGQPGPDDDYDFIPIEVIEELLRIIYSEDYSITIVSQQACLNSHVVHCKLMIDNGGTENYRAQVFDGIGAKDYEYKSNNKGNRIEYNMHHSAVSQAAPIAYTRAVKNAAKKLGRIFGSELNRTEDSTPVKQQATRSKRKSQPDQIGELLKDEEVVLTKEDREGIERILEKRERNNYKKALTLLQSKKKQGEKDK